MIVFQAAITVARAHCLEGNCRASNTLLKGESSSTVARVCSCASDVVGLFACPDARCKPPAAAGQQLGRKTQGPLGLATHVTWMQDLVEFIGCDSTCDIRSSSLPFASHLKRTLP
jgi:hypothetical protein